MPERKRGTGSAGRFGPRYGRVARRRVSEIEGAMRRKHACPDCGAKRVSRDGTGIWECSRCGHRFTGGSYRPETPGGRTARQSIRAALSEGGEEDDEGGPATGDGPDVVTEDAPEAVDAAPDEVPE